jgi:membrane protease YdiL (CAAX protease family)
MSRVAVVLAVVFTLILALYVSLESLAVLLALGGGAVVLRLFVQIRGVTKDRYVSRGEQHDVLKWILVGLLALEIGNLAFPRLYNPPVPQTLQELALVAPFVVALFGFAIVVYEEVFFRGEFLDIFASLPSPRMGNRDVRGILRTVALPGAIVLSALLFTFFHFQVYGTQPEALALVFMGGLVLAYAAWKTKRLVTPLIIHFINNFFNVPFGQYILLIVLGFTVYFYLRGKSARARGGRGRW